MDIIIIKKRERDGEGGTFIILSVHNINIFGMGMNAAYETPVP